jgi:hypothetical protein
VRVDDILIHPRDRDLIIGTHGRSIWICDDISALEQLKPTNKDLTLFDARPAVLWKNDPQAQRHDKNRSFVARNPQGGTAITFWAKSDMGAGKVEFLQNNAVVASTNVDVKAGMNRFQWALRGPPPAAATATGGRGGRRGGSGGAAATDPATPQAAAGATSPATPPAAAAAADQAAFGGGGGRRGGATGVPFVASGGRGGGGGGGGGFGGFGGAPQGALLEPGAYFVRLTVGGQVLTSSVNILEDIWMRPQ